MRFQLAIIACILAVQAGAAQAQSPPIPKEVTPPVVRHDWAQIFPITPAFADWVRAGQVLDKAGVVTGDAWLHRDSLRIKRTGSYPLIEADILVNFNGQGGTLPGYIRFLQVISCGEPTFSVVKAVGRVTVSGDVIRPASLLTSQPWSNTDFGFARLICFDQAFQARFLARN